MRLFQKVKPLLGDFARNISEHDILAQAAAIAFYTALSFAPLVLLLVSIGGLVGEGTKNELLGQFSRELGPGSADVARSVVAAADRAGQGSAPAWKTAMSAIGLLVTASAVFGQLQSALNTMWEVVAKPAVMRPGRGRLWTFSVTVWQWLRKRLLSMGMVLVVLLILLVSLVISAALGGVLPASEGREFAARILDFGVSLVVAALLFAAIFKVLPDAPVTWRQAWLGALLTSVLFNLGKLALSLYIVKAGVGKDYGEAVGGLIALLVWVYYSSVALLLGAEVTQHISRPARADRPETRQS